MRWQYWLEIRLDERRSVSVAFITLFAIVAGHSILETARDSLFLARIEAEKLPIAYIAIAVLVFVVGQTIGWLRTRVARAALLPIALVVSGLVTACFWLGIHPGANFLLYALYVWSGVVGTFVVGLFWVRTGDIFDVSQAKRIYPMVGIGGVAGATVGALAADRLLSLFEQPTLILAAAGVYIFAGAWVGLCWSSSDTDRPDREDDLRSEKLSRIEILRREPYVRHLSLLIALSMVTVTIVDYIFKSTVAESVPANELGSFFANYYASVNALGAVVQIVIAPAVLSYLGVNRAVVLFPLLLVASSLGLVFAGGITAAMILKGVDGSLRHSLYRTSMEILYLPLSSNIRSRLKALIDGVAQRGGQAIASLAIICYSALEFTPKGLALVVSGLSVVWIIYGFRMRRGYLNLFRERLSLGRIDARADIPDLDLSALEQLLEALNSPDDETVVAALGMFSLYQRGHIVPALILYHPSPRVVAKAADVFSESRRVDVGGVAGRLIKSPNAAIRASALRLIVSDQKTFSSLEHEVEAQDDPVISGMLALGRFNAEEISEQQARDEIRGVFQKSSGEALRGLAQAMRGNRSAMARWALTELAKLDHPELNCDVAMSMAEVPNPVFLKPLVKMLGSRIARPEARVALVALGDVALEFLETVASCSDLDRRVKRHIPRSISPFRGQDAVDALVRLYQKSEEGYVRFKILRALGRLIADQPKLSVDVEFLERELENCLRRLILTIDFRSSTEVLRLKRHRYRHPAIDLLIDTLHGKEISARERLFRFLAIRYPRENVHEIYKGLTSANPRVRAGSRELLENIVTPPYRFAVVALVDDLSNRDKLARASYYYDPSAGFNPLDLEASFMLRLYRMLESSSRAIRMVSAYAVEQLDIRVDGRLPATDDAMGTTIIAQPDGA